VSEASTYLAEIDWVLREEGACLEALTAAELNAAYGGAEANSPSAIVGHTLAVTDAFVFGVVMGQVHVRDRPGEFATAYRDLPEALEAIGALRRRLSTANMSSLDLARVVMPDPDTWGSADAVPMELRRVLAETLRHAAIHLGELRLVRSLAVAQRSAGA